MQGIPIPFLAWEDPMCYGATEAHVPGAHAHWIKEKQEKSWQREAAHRNEAATRESPHAAMKTQLSPKENN